MRVFVVIDSMMMGRNANGIFTSFERAQLFKEEFVKESNYVCRIEEIHIQGKYQLPDPIFAAQKYDSSKDIHVFVGLYANENEATQAAGKKGEVLTFIPDMP